MRLASAFFPPVFSLVLAAIAIVLRVWVRRIQSRSLAFNDWLLFPAWVRILSPHEGS